MDKIFVIAGNDKEAIKWMKEDSLRRWCKNTTSASLSEYEYIICRGVSNIKGYRNPHGVFIGTWRDRSDIKDIIMALMTATYETNPKLRKIWNEIYPIWNDLAQP